MERVVPPPPSLLISGAEWNCLYGQLVRVISPEEQQQQGQGKPGSIRGLLGEEEEVPGRAIRTGGAYANDENLSNFLIRSSSSSSSSLGTSSSASWSIQSLGRGEVSSGGLSPGDGRQGSSDAGNYDYGRRETNGTMRTTTGEVVVREVELNFPGRVDSDENLGSRPSDGLSGHKGNFCNTSWDGLLCWPQAEENTSVSLPCFKHFRGIAYNETGTVTRLCQAGGIWQNKTDYSECIPKPHPTIETVGAGVTHDVYFSGYCLSLSTLLIAMVIFVTFKELRCLRNKIHTQLILTYILADALWLLISIQSNIGHHQTQISCAISFILLHYFHLTTFFWMFVEGLYLYLLVVKTFTFKQNLKLRIYNFVGWGLPLIVVTVWSIAKWNNQPTNLTMTSTELHRFDTLDTEIQGCIWLTVNIYDWIYKLPAILVLAANSIFLLQIMWVLITKLRSATNPETQQSRKAAKALVVLMPLLGITYVLVLRGSGQTPGYEITRALLISTQGFIVAVTFCFLNGEVRNSLRHRWNLLRDFMGPDLTCSCCFMCDGQSSGLTEWSPRSQTESIRLYTPTPTPTKRGSSTSESTTTATTVLGGNSCGSILVTSSSNPSRKTSTSVVTSIKSYNSNDNNFL